MLTVTALASSLIALEAKAPVFAPPFIISLIAAAVFTLLGFVVFSFKNYANRTPPRGQASFPEHEGPIDEFGHAEEH
ncbi:hypothetical protein [Frondihabitans cladoniiphilus]|uniref:Uncharacterized protein n=1 Tax=Frondihabitans cladoniiphilus TaxID=715785 RepID=A0ABP8VRS2_9MICO